jgi:hypothetical protein
VGEARAGRVWAAIDARALVEGATPSIRHACVACAAAIGAIGAGFSMTRGPGLRGAGLREPVLATDPRSEELEELQFTLGQGPCVDVAGGDGPVLVGDLSSAASRRRWPVFAPAAAERGVRGLFALPIGAGAIRLGVLDLYRLNAGMLSDGELADALAYADAVLVLALDQRGGIAFDLRDRGLAVRRAEVHQAAGMISVQLGVDVIDALTRLRAYAYLNNRRLAEVASAVVARRLVFQPDTWGIGPEMGAGEDPNGE